MLNEGETVAVVNGSQHLDARAQFALSSTQNSGEGDGEHGWPLLSTMLESEHERNVATENWAKKPLKGRAFY